MRYFTTFLFLVLSTALFAQEWTFKKSLNLDIGPRIYDSDLGLGGGIDVGLSGMIYNVNRETSGLVFSTRVFFNNFSKSDRGTSAKREFIGFKGGFGLHAQQRFFGTVNVGYLKLLNTSELKDSEMPKGLFFGSAQLDADVARFDESGLAFRVSIEGGLTFEDVELVERSGDTFRGTGFVSLRVGIVKTIGVKNKLAKEKKE